MLVQISEDSRVYQEDGSRFGAKAGKGLPPEAVPLGPHAAHLLESLEDWPLQLNQRLPYDRLVPSNKEGKIPNLLTYL